VKKSVAVVDDSFIPSDLRPSSDPPKRRGFIYFMGAEKGDEPIKVGWAGDVAARLKGVQTGSYSRLIVHGTVPGTTEEEAWVHRRLEPHRVHGEWFEREPALAELAWQQQRRQALDALYTLRKRRIPELLEQSVSFAEIGAEVSMSARSVARWCVRELGMEIDYGRLKQELARERELQDRLRETSPN
jgi:T5orf172 domain